MAKYTAKGVQWPYALRSFTSVIMALFTILFAFALVGCAGQDRGEDSAQAASGFTRAPTATLVVTNTNVTMADFLSVRDAVNQFKGAISTLTTRQDETDVKLNEILARQVPTDTEGLRNFLRDAIDTAGPQAVSNLTAQGAVTPTYTGVVSVNGVTHDVFDVNGQQLMCYEIGRDQPAGKGVQAGPFWFFGNGTGQILGPIPPGIVCCAGVMPCNNCNWNGTAVPTAVPTNTPRPRNTDETPPSTARPTNTPTQSATPRPSCEWDFDHFWAPEQCRYFDSHGLPVRINIEKRILLPDRQPDYTENWVYFMNGYRGYITGEGDFTIYCRDTPESVIRKDSEDHAARRRLTDDFIRNKKRIGEVTEDEMRKWGIISDSCEVATAVPPTPAPVPSATAVASCDSLSPLDGDIVDVTVGYAVPDNEFAQLEIYFDPVKPGDDRKEWTWLISGPLDLGISPNKSARVKAWRYDKVACTQGQIEEQHIAPHWRLRQTIENRLTFWADDGIKNRLLYGND